MKTIATFTFHNAAELTTALASALYLADLKGARPNEIMIVTSESGAISAAPVLRLFEETVGEESHGYSIAIRA